MSEPAFDELLRRLAAAEVDFVVVGGLAVNAWGVVRGTKNVDVVVDSDIENLKRVAAVAVTARGHVQQGEALLGSRTSIAAALAGGEQVAIETDLGRYLSIDRGLKPLPNDRGALFLVGGDSWRFFGRQPALRRSTTADPDADKDILHRVAPGFEREPLVPGSSSRGKSQTDSYVNGTTTAQNLLRTTLT